MRRPSHRRIGEPGDAGPSWHPPLDRGLDNGGREEGQRDRHPDRALGLALAGRDGLDALLRGGHQFVEPMVAVAQSFDDANASLLAHRADRCSLRALDMEDLPAAGREGGGPANGKSSVPALAGDGVAELDRDRGAADCDALDRSAQVRSVGAAAVIVVVVLVDGGAVAQRFNDPLLDLGLLISVPD